MEITKKIKMKTKKLKTKKQIKKETIDFYVNLINLNEEEGKIEGLKEDLESDIEYYKTLNKKGWKPYIRGARMAECEEILEKNGVKMESETDKGFTLKELSAYKKKAKKVKFSSEEKKAIKKYFRNKKNDIKEFAQLNRDLRKLGITLEELDTMSLIEIYNDAFNTINEDKKDVLNILNETELEESKVDEVKSEEVKVEKVESEEIKDAN